MDGAEPPRIVFESVAKCVDREGAEALLRRTLAASSAPRGSWSVSMRIDPSSGGGLHAQGTIADQDGTTVAHRELTETGSECRGLARAVGVWASLVLDAARERAGAPVATDETAQPPPSPVASAEVPRLPPWPADASPPDKPGEPDRPAPRAEDGARLELGVGAFLMTGTGGEPVAGPTPFVFFELAPGVLLRPSMGVGQSLGWLRIDTCLRIQGRYSNRHGLQLDMCGGADLVVYYTWAARPDAIGPSVDLRGELGGDLAVALRAVVGLNAAARQSVTDGNIDSSPWSGRVELALSWRLR